MNSRYLPAFSRFVSAATALTFLLISGVASATVIDINVAGSTSLYHDDWGHIYNVSGGGNEFDALGRGVAATAVGHSFVVGQTVNILASDCVVDAGTACTGPDGFPGSLWRGLDVYSLIGIWSSSSMSIVPAGSAFLVGSSLSTFAAGEYLFLAENNGVFVDNHDGEYAVRIEVPEPGVLALLGIGLLGMGLTRRRKKA